MTLHARAQADAHLDQAQLALDAQVPALAQVDLDQAVRLQPDQAQVRLAQAQACLSTGHVSQAVAALDALTQYHPEQARLPHLRLMQSRVLAQQGQLELADQHLQNLAREYPDDVRAHRLLAVLAMRLGQAQTAIIHLRQLLRLNPSDQTARRALTRLLTEHQPQAGLELLRQEQQASANSTHQLQQARLYRRLGRWREAEDIFAQLLQRHAEDGPLAMEAGELAEQMGNHVLALRRFDLAAGRPGPQQSAVQKALVNLLLQAGRWAKVLGLCRAMIRERRDEDYAWTGMLVCGLALNRPRLISRANRYLESHTSPRERRIQLARLWKSAVLGIAPARIHTPAAQRPSPLQSLLQGALHTLTRQQETHPRRADVCYHLANCHAALGHASQARQALAKALAINPRYAAAHRLLKRLGPERLAA